MDDKERHSVVWRAIHQKEEFFEETENLKDLLFSELSEIEAERIEDFKAQNKEQKLESIAI